MTCGIVKSLGEGLVLDIEPIEVAAENEYAIAGVYSFGRGLFGRGRMPGAKTAYKTLFRLRTGQLVLSRLKAFEGAVAVVTPEFDGWYLSPEFPTFSCIQGVLDSDYLAHVCRWPNFWSRLASSSKGLGARRERVHPEQLRALEIPMPPIDEQRRVAGRLDVAVAGRTRVSSLSARCSVLADAAAVSIASRPDLTEATKSARGWRQVTLGEVLQPAMDVFTVNAQSTYPNVGILSFGRGVFEKPPIDGSVTSARSLNQIHSGQFIYSRLFAFEGAYASVPIQYDGYFVSNEFPTLDTNPSHIDARWLATYFRSPERWAELRGASKGLGLRRQRVPVEALLAYRIWLPPVSEQRRMLSQIDALEELSKRRGRFNQLATALMPALLNEAFADSG